jgi:hypothetical protein
MPDDPSDVGGYSIRCLDFQELRLLGEFRTFENGEPLEGLISLEIIRDETVKTASGIVFYRGPLIDRRSRRSYAAYVDVDTDRAGSIKSAPKAVRGAFLEAEVDASFIAL